MTAVSAARRGLVLALVAIVAFPGVARAGWWTDAPSTTATFSGVSCLSTSLCVGVASSGGLVWRDSAIGAADTTSSGWTSASAGSSAWGAISCWGSASCVVVGAGGAIAYTTNVNATTPTWTTPTTVPSGSPVLDGVSCVSGSCVAVGSGGVIWSSSSPGTSWAAQTSPTSTTLNAVSCASATVCGAAGAGTFVLSGGTWGRGDTATETFEGISCPTTSTCTAVATDGTIAQTTNGTTWATATSPTTSALDAVSCADATDCVAVGAGGTVVGSANGGVWATESAGEAVALSGVACASASTCVLVGAGGAARHTNDAGTFGWISVSSDTTVNLRAVACPTGQTCFAVGDSGTLDTTTDAGKDWTASTLGSGSVNLYAIACATSSECVAGGTGGQAFTYNGTSWTADAAATGTNTITGLACPNQMKCYATDAGGNIYMSTNAGAGWGRAQLTGAGPLQGIECSDPTDCKAVGTGSTYLWYTANGTSWAAVPSSVTTSIPAGSKFSAISCATSGSNPFCAGVGAGSVIFYGTSTATRPTFISGSNANLAGVGCRSTSVCEAVGASGTMLATTDGGADWMSSAAPGSGTLEAVTMASTALGIAVGDGGTIERMVNLSAPTCSAGSLSLSSAPATITFATTVLSGKSQTATATPPFIVDDESSGHTGWSLTATSTPFSNGTQTLSNSATTVSGVTFTPNAGSCAAPQATLTYPITVPASATPPTATAIASVASGTGEGPITVAPTLSLALPATTRAGTYSSTWTVSVVSGP